MYLIFSGCGNGDNHSSVIEEEPSSPAAPVSSTPPRSLLGANGPTIPAIPTDMGECSYSRSATWVGFSRYNGSGSWQYEVDYPASTRDGHEFPGGSLAVDVCNNEVKAALEIALRNGYKNCAVDLFLYQGSGTIIKVHDCDAPNVDPIIPPGERFVGGKAQRIAQDYAPSVYLYPAEMWLPSSIDYYAQYVRLECGNRVISDDILTLEAAELPEGKGGAENNLCYLTPKVPFGDPYDQPTWLRGQDPSSGNVPVYVNIYQDERDPKTESNFIAQYMFFFPYNYGKNVCMDVAPNDKCFGARRVLGSHVGDWELVSIRFVNGLPKSVHVGAHGNDEPNTASTYFCCDWNNANSESILEWRNNHPVVYAAEGSHGIWGSVGKKNYMTISTGDQLNDYTGQGVYWETWKNMVWFSYTRSDSLSVLLNDYEGRWGARKMGRNACQIKDWRNSACEMFGIPFDELELNDGPSLPNRERDRSFLYR